MVEIVFGYEDGLLTVVNELIKFARDVLRIDIDLNVPPTYEVRLLHHYDSSL